MGDIKSVPGGMKMNPGGHEVRTKVRTMRSALVSTHMSCTTMYWWGMRPSTPLCRPSHQSSEARWYSNSDAPFLKDSSRGERPT